MASSVRHRGIDSRNKSLFSHKVDEKIKLDDGNYLRPFIWIILISFHFMLLLYVHRRNTYYPRPVLVSSANNNNNFKNGQFVAERAKWILQNITKHGVHIVGSKENEIDIVNYILMELKQIQKSSADHSNIEINSQRFSGSFGIPFPKYFVNSYSNVNNIVAKLTPKHGRTESLMLNCHYDSAIGSPGASDDAVSCALMLEVLRVLSQEKNPLTYSIIFVFNGAEETICEASHGFITQHKWAKDIRAFINLEAAGAGGKEIVFQSGPNHPWLVNLYSNHVPHPSAAVVGQELFASGIIPSDTDYRIYRDFGGLPGLDIAYITNGFVYHTPYDTADRIPPGCIQRGGDNLLALVRAIGNSSFLVKPGEYRHGQQVYFDIVGLIMINYPARIGVIINTVTALVVFMGVVRKVILGNRKQGMMGLTYRKLLVKCMLINVAAWLFAILFCAALGYSLEILGRPMSWYTTNWLAPCLYAIPALFVQIGIHQMAKRWLLNKQVDAWNIQAVQVDSARLLIALLLAPLTWRGICSSYLLMLWLFFPMAVSDLGQKLTATKPKDQHGMFLMLHLLGGLLPSLIFAYLGYAVLLMFIPIMGRAGSDVIPDIFVGVLISVLVSVVSTYHINLVYVTRQVGYVLRVLVVVWLISLLLALLTPLGFPYHADISSPTQQRHFIHHIQRTHHDVSGEVIHTDSGMWSVPLDRYGIKSLASAMPILREARDAACDHDQPYCGYPWLLPLLPMVGHTVYIPDAAPSASPEVTVSMVVDEKVAEPMIWRISFNVSGPSRLLVYLLPREGCSLTRWSFEPDSILPPNPTRVRPGMPGKHYFISHTSGLHLGEPWHFWLDVKADPGVNVEKGLITAAVSGHYLTANNPDHLVQSIQLDKYIQQFPDWVTPIGWVATYKSWVVAPTKE